MLRLLYCLIALLPSFCRGQAPSIHTYYEDLTLDLYQPTEAGDDLVLYVHGGGFSGGDRGEGRDLCTYLQQQGIACASITYTLSMQGRAEDWSCDGILSEKLKALQLAANEVWAATALLTGADSPLPRTPERVFLAGSSAGAEAVLHAAFYDRKELQLIEHELGQDLRYAGIISGAGALVATQLITEATVVPLLLLHGTADPLVPYGAASHHYCAPDKSGWLMLFGAGALADHLDTLKRGSYTLYTHPGAGHEIAGRYFHQEYGVTLDFIRRVARGGRFRERYVVE